MNDKRIVCWFSCGAASAVASMLAIKKYGRDRCVFVYQETGAEHPDNDRFLSDFEKRWNISVERIKSPSYEDIWDVFEKTRWLVGPAGARCTSELKRRVAENYLDWFRDIEVLGYTIDEEKRFKRWVENNPERDMDPLLITEGWDKQRCFYELDKMGIKRPVMYDLGYKNNNCIGCVKGGQKYWNMIRKDFPDVFDRMSKVERELNVAINKTYAGDGKRKKLFLDELDPTAGRNAKEPSMTCGFLCGSEDDE